jgi:hypothetical protein
MNWKRWAPSSKITAVLLTGIVYTAGLWLLTNYYGLDAPPVNVALTQTWVTFIIGYAITENRLP